MRLLKRCMCCHEVHSFLISNHSHTKSGWRNFWTFKNNTLDKFYIEFTKRTIHLSNFHFTCCTYVVTLLWFHKCHSKLQKKMLWVFTRRVVFREWPNHEKCNRSISGKKVVPQLYPIVVNLATIVQNCIMGSLNYQIWKLPLQLLSRFSIFSTQ